jgi:hypothetical protein
VLLGVWVLEISVRFIFMRRVLFLHSAVNFVLCDIMWEWLKVIHSQQLSLQFVGVL